MDGASRIEFNVTTNPTASSGTGESGIRRGVILHCPGNSGDHREEKMDTPGTDFSMKWMWGSAARQPLSSGNWLRELGESTQVMCVTTLPQAAGGGHQHTLSGKHNFNGTENRNCHAVVG